MTLMVKPLRPCGHPGCPELVAGPRCPAHERVREKDPAQARFYGSGRWKRIRAMVRKQEPICRICQRRPTQEVHHLDGDWRNNNRENLAGACRPCHASASARQHNRKREDG